MYTTIEPRLIALLNNDDEPSQHYTTSPSLELPPLHDPNILKASGRPLLLEPDTSKRNGKPSPNAQLTPQPSLISTPDEEKSKTNVSKKKAGSVAERALGSSSPQSLRKILDDDSGHSPAQESKKRNIVENTKDDFVQLPQPPKKQKATKQVVPPIIIGLFEPPPQAALFPPIASSAFHDSHGRNSLNTIPPKVKELQEASGSQDSPTTSSRKKAAGIENAQKDAKVRKRWSEDETKNLLLGVHKYGVGRWTDILEDPSFWFNDRSGVDLKDRFRTCCPVELRGKAPKPKKAGKRAEISTRKGLNQGKAKSSLMSENILIDEGKVNVNAVAEDTPLPHTSSRKSRAHRKRLEDLAYLGIEGPFKKSLRRERRPFSEEDDREILVGYNIYGPAWTRIQRDIRFHLQSRQPTDLRDRFRNKYPDKFRSEDSKETSTYSQNFKTTQKDASAGQQTPTPHLSSNREGLRIEQIISLESDNEKSISKALPIQPPKSNFGFGDNFVPFPEHPVESAYGLPFPQSFDWNGSMTAPFSGNMGEMDISRLLLDESWIDSAVKEKPSFKDINNIITSSADTLPQVSSFLNMLACDSDQINMSSSSQLDQDTSFG